MCFGERLISAFLTTFFVQGSQFVFLIQFTCLSFTFGSRSLVRTTVRTIRTSSVAGFLQELGDPKTHTGLRGNFSCDLQIYSSHPEWMPLPNGTNHCQYHCAFRTEHEQNMNRTWTYMNILILIMIFYNTFNGVFSLQTALSKKRWVFGWKLVGRWTAKCIHGVLLASKRQK